MAILPQLELAVISANWSAVLDRVTRFLLDRLVQRLSKHWLVQVARTFDFTPLEQACAAYHHQRGPGAPPQHTVPRLVRLLVIKYGHDFSLRQTEEALQRDLLLQWFCGYAPWEELPDYSTLERFEQWVLQHHERLFFDSTLQQIDADLPLQRNEPQIIDSYALRSRAAKVSLVTLLRELSAKLLKALHLAHPLRHTRLLQQLNREDLWGAAKENHQWSDAAVRLAALQKMIPQIMHCRKVAHELLAEYPPLPPERQKPLQTWLHYLDKALTDELVIEQQGEGWIVRERQTKEKGDYRIVSASDPDATLRDHGKDKPVEVGYSSTILVNPSGIVRETLVQTGSCPDDQAIVPALQSQKEHHDLIPAIEIGDGAYGRGKTHADVAEATDGQTQLVTPPPRYDQRSTRFTPYDFAPSADGQSLTCPHGVSTTLHYYSATGQGWVWRFTAKMCQGCPLHAQCRDAKSKPDSHRMVFISDFRTFVLASTAASQTEEHKALMKLRPGVERVIFCLTNLHGGREARRFGLPNAQFQSHMVAMAYNLRQWMRLRGRLGKEEAACPVAFPTPIEEGEALLECVAQAA